MGLTTGKKRPKGSRVKKAIVNSFLGLSVAAVLLAAAWALFFNTDDVFLFGYKPYIIASESMEPAFKKYAFVLIKKESSANIKAGEVIAFKAAQISGKAALHRVVDITADGFVTKGDANKRVDEQIVTGDAFLGREVWHTNLTATLFMLAQAPGGIVYIVIFPCVTIVLVVILIQALRKLAGRRKLE